MKLTPITLVLALSLLFSGACATKTISLGEPDSFVANLPGAPAPGSPEDLRDHEALVQFQKNRTPADCARAGHELAVSLETFYGPPYGPLTQNQIQPLEKTFAELSEFAWYKITDAKKRWQRPRPFLTHADLKPCVKLEKSFTYPSGHAAISHFYMHILETIFPMKRPELEARAEQIALDRNIAGVHYPTDVRDGKLLGDEIFDFVKKDPKFQSLLEKAKSETASFK